MRYWAEWLMGGIAALLALGHRQLSARVKAAHGESEALKQGMRALLRDRMIQGYHHYMEKGCWPIYSRDAMADMHKQYTALGGNGVVMDLLKDLTALPTERKEKGKEK